MIDRGEVADQWRRAIAARDSCGAHWVSAWNAPFEQLRISFEAATRGNDEARWFDFLAKARSLRETMGGAFPLECVPYYVSLVQLTDYVSAKTDFQQQSSGKELDVLSAASVDLRQRLDEALTLLEGERKLSRQKDRTLRALEKAIKALSEARGNTTILSNLFSGNRTEISPRFSARTGDINAVKKEAGGLAKWVKVAIDALSHEWVRQLVADALMKVVAAAKKVLAAARTAYRERWTPSKRILDFERTEPRFDIADDNAENLGSHDSGNERQTISDKRARRLVLRGRPPPNAWCLEQQYMELAGTRVPRLMPLSRMFNLHYVNLNRTQVDDLWPLSRLTRLQTLYLKRTPVFDLAPLASLTDLHELHLEYTAVEDIEPLSRLFKLQRLYLSQTDVSDLSPLANLKQLERLAVDETRVSDLSPLATLTNLRFLKLMRTKVDDLLPLTELKTLRSLDLEGTGVTDLSPLARLSKLEILDLGDTKVCDLAPLSNLKMLTTVTLPGTKVDDLTAVSHVPHVVEPFAVRRRFVGP